MKKFMVEHQLNVLFRSIVLSAPSKLVYPVNSGSHWSHILGYIQLCLVYISIHVFSSETVLVDS
jgi:hypothetical protein